MRLPRLIADFNLIEARLTHSLGCEVSVRIRVALTRRAASLMDSIERHVPDSIAEARTKIEFFLHRAQRGRSRHDLAIALDLIAQFENWAGAALPCHTRSANPHEVLDRLVSRGVEAAPLSKHISALAERASLLDHQFRHICTSRGNAAFHAMAPERFESLHMADLIGPQRYLNRSLAHLTAAMSGHRRSYYYTLDVPILGPRVIQCAMRPWALPSGEASGVMMWVDDVTDRLGRMHGFGDVPFALPDHSIDGTT